MVYSRQSSVSGARGNHRNCFKRWRMCQHLPGRPSVSNSDPAKAKLGRLSSIYDEIIQCRSCIGKSGSLMGDDTRRVRRVVKTESLASSIFVIAQALGGETQRLTGLPYVRPDGRLSNTGNRFERFLSLIGYTVNSSSTDSGLSCAYCSDIVYCYPGKNPSGKGDRTPTSEEINICLGKRFVIREIEIVDPQLVILAGKVSYHTFYRNVLKLEPSESVSNARDNIISCGKIPQYPIAGKERYVVPIQHPSGANPQFQKTLNDIELLSMMKEILR